MAALTLTIPDAQVARLVAAVAQQRGLDVSAMTAPQKILMMKQDIVAYWIQVIQASELPAVQAAASTTAVNARIADINANLQVT